jgi:lysophospholipase L1-like esterase
VVTVAVGGSDVRAHDRSTFAAQVDRLTRALPGGTYVADAAYSRHGRWRSTPQFAPDGFHPIGRGHREWADAFWQEMSSEAPRR